MAQLTALGPLGTRNQDKTHARRNPSPFGNKPVGAGHGQRPGPVGVRDSGDHTPLKSRSQLAPSPEEERGIKLAGQETKLRQIAEIVAKYSDQMSDACGECSSTSFKQMKIVVSPLRAEEDGQSTGTYAKYLLAINTAVVYQQFFDRPYIIQVSTIFHEYLHSLPGNIAMWQRGTAEEQALPHAQRPWEKEVLRLERIFQDRFGQRIMTGQ